MTRRLALLLLMIVAGPAAAQTNGSIIGRVRQRDGGAPVGGAEIGLDSRWVARTDSTGFYRIREVRSGWHLVTVRAIGFETARRDSVLVRAGQISVVNVVVDVYTIDRPVVVEAYADSILDPTMVATVQRIGADELRRFPVTTLEEAVALSAGAVGESYRGGRLGQQAFVLDGLGVKNQLDASTGPLGVRIPPDVLTEAALATNGFSARYGQAISGLINIVTKDGGDRWSGRAAYESDRLLWGGADLGLDRVVLSADGPLGRGAGFVAVLDAEGRLDADPTSAPPPDDPQDPRHDRPWMLPHNSGERYDAAVKLRVPLGATHTLRLFGLRSADQRLLFDPAYKYDSRWAPARRVSGNLLAGHLQRATNTFTADLRAGSFTREFIRGALTEQPPYRFGAVTGRTFEFAGEAVARAQDTVAAGAPLPGMEGGGPDWSERSPWGVPAFFRSLASNGELTWNSFQELRGQLDFSVGGPKTDLYFGAEVSRQRVRTFQRALGYLPVGDSVPPPAASRFTPTSAAGYAEGQLHGEDFVITLGVRYDQFDPGSGVPGAVVGARRSVNPRLAFSTVLKGATLVASWGRFSQAPDFQYLVDAAFDDTLRTGRFRRGNPNIGFEDATQYEFSLRTRPSANVTLRVNVFNKLLDQLIGSIPLGVDEDSTIFGNFDFGNVKGAEAILERAFVDGWGARVSYALQSAQATATDAFQLVRRIRIGPTGDTINPARVQFPLDFDRRHSLTIIGQGRVPEGWGPRLGGIQPVAGLEGATIVRYNSGLPFTMTNATGDTLLGLPNSHRLPPVWTIDVLLRRPLRIAGRQGTLYIDVRNLLNRRNIEAVRRDSGEPQIDDPGLAALAERAYQAHPEPIPYESPRYRPAADVDRNGLIEGHAELYPLYLSAARDYTQPLFSYGPPRMFRLGVELLF